jgi:hypothetical protein
MAKAKPVTAAGRKRVQAALDTHGMLLVQGQYDLPSIADLLEGAPITTRGYSYDYVPAWQVRWELVSGPDYVLVKLFDGMNTVVHRRHWPALNALGAATREAVLKSHDGPSKMLKVMESRPGITGDEIKQALKLAGKPGTRDFQRDKTRLEQWLCVEGREQEETGHHTHDSAWYPWALGKTGSTSGLSPQAAVTTLMQAVYGKGAPEDERSLIKAFPVWRMAR